MPVTSIVAACILESCHFLFIALVECLGDGDEGRLNIFPRRLLRAQQDMRSVIKFRIRHSLTSVDSMTVSSANCTVCVFLKCSLSCCDMHSVTPGLMTEGVATRWV